MSDSESVESCYTCGIRLDDENRTYVTGFSSTSDEMRQFCSKQCLEKNIKFVSPQMDPQNPLAVPVKGKCGDEVINGVAEFDMHGTVRLNFTHPQLNGSFTVPKTFLEIVAELYTPDEHSE